jgi:hypothetical protein
MGLPESLSKTCLYAQGRNRAPNWVLENSRLVSFGLATNAPTGAPPRAPWGAPSQLQGLAPGKDPVGRTALRPPMDAGGGQVPVNLVQTRRCQLKSRGYPLQRTYWLWQVLAVRRCRKGSAGGASHLPTRVLPSSSVDRARQYRARSGLGTKRVDSGHQRIPYHLRKQGRQSTTLQDRPVGSANRL